MLGTGDGVASPVVPQIGLTDFAGCSTRDDTSAACLASKCSWASRTNNPWFGVNADCRSGEYSAQCYCPV